MTITLRNLLTTFTLLLITTIGFAQAPILGADSSFALFTAVGALSNIGTTYITGDIGSNGGSFTGFPPGIVNGQTHIVDTESVIAARDVSNAYAYLAGITCDSVIGIALGNNQVLMPNVYCIGGASTLNGELTLDAQGDSNALFIFKINGPLATSTFAKVILINAAQHHNVYWQINGTFDLLDSSTFTGTVIANGAISLSQGSYFTGRALSSGGAIYLQNAIVNIGLNSSIPLPITLVSFNAKRSDICTCVNLAWQTASEDNSAYFLIERCNTGNNFIPIAKINAAGHSVQLLSYSYIDKNPIPGINYYRLNEVDLNGYHEIFPIKSIDFPDYGVSVNIYPNPFTTSLDIVLNNPASINNARLKIYNVLGEEVMDIVITKQLNVIQTSVLPSGIYFYTVINDDKTIQSGKLIAQHQ